MQILILQRQNKLDEVTGRTGEADGLGDIPATQPPLTTPLERRDSSTADHDTGTHCGPAGCTHTGLLWKISEQGIILETKSLGGGDGGCTPVNDPIMLPFMGENTSGVEALQLLFLSLLPPPRRRNT